jgi:hypothetical protein
MEFKGLIVKHKSFGEGYIENIDEKNIYIYFPHRTNGNKNVAFEFPNSFIKEYLYCEDETFNTWLNNNIVNSTCSICDKYNKDIQTIDGILICSSCAAVKTVMCKQCKKPHLIQNMVSIEMTTYPYRNKEMCIECAQDKAFLCEACNSRYLLSEVKKYAFNEKMLCEDCFNDTAKICYICGETLDYEKCETVFTGSDEVDVCYECIDKETFVCSACNHITLSSYMAKSKYISTDEKICLDCVCHCGICGEAIRGSKREWSFNKCYCSDCWESRKTKCPICDDEFISQDEKVCPDCIDMINYIERLKRVDFGKYRINQVSYGELDYLDRCKLFTDLFSNNNELPLGANKDDKECLVIEAYGLKMVTVYLPNHIVGNVRYIKNVTMTEFRRRKIIDSIYFKIHHWLPKCDDVVDVEDKKMTLLKYPILLRVQTEFDKVYGKNWNGPDDYIEIGNYGDTTDFYIVGIINKDS